MLKKDVNAWDVAIEAWSTPNEGEAVSGYDRIIAEAGPEYTWEGILIDPSRPWAAELRSEHPEVVRNIEANLERRAKGVTDLADGERGRNRAPRPRRRTRRRSPR